MDNLFDFTSSDWRSAILGALLTLFLSIFGWFLVQLRESLHLRLTKNLWKPFLRKPRATSVVLTTKNSLRPSGTQKASLSEVQAFSELRNTLSQLKIDTQLVQDPDATLTKLYGKHIISIGGPKHNNVTREILAMATSKYRIPIRYDSAGEYLQEGTDIFKSEEAQDGTLLKDFGFVIRLTGLCGNQNLSYLVAFGLRGRGTWGAVRTLTADDELMKKIDSQVGKSDFAILIESKFKDNLLVANSIISAYPLIQVK